MTFNAILERHSRRDDQRKEEISQVVNRVKQMPGEFLGSVGRLGDGGLFEQESDTIDQFAINTWNNLDPKVKENIQNSAAKFAHAWEGAGKLDATGYNPFDYIGDVGAYGTVKALNALGKWWEWGHTVRSGILQLAGVDKGAADKIAISRQLLTGRAFPKARIPGVSTTTTPYTQGINPVQVKKPPINVTPNTFTKTIDTIFKVPRFRGTSVLNQKLLGEEMFNIPLDMQRRLFGITQTPEGPVYAFQSTIQQWKNESNQAYIKRYWDTKFDELGIPEGLRFSLREMLDSDHLTKAQRRNIKAGISNPNYVFRDYKESRHILVNDFLDGLEAFGIDPSTIEIHHISSLRHVAQLFEGLEREKWPEMLAELYKAGLATGNDPNNLMAMFAKAHRSVKSSNIDSVHQYLDKELGKYNEKITGDFGDNIRDLSIEQRIPSIRRYAATRQSSIQVANDAIRQVLDEIVLDQGGSIDALLDNVVFSQDQIEFIQSKIKQHLDMQFNPQGWGALGDAVRDDVSGAQAKQDRGLTPSGPTQGQLMDLGKKTRPKKTSNKNQKQYRDDSSDQKPPERDETKPMDPPPEKD